MVCGSRFTEASIRLAAPAFFTTPFIVVTACPECTCRQLLQTFVLVAEHVHSRWVLQPELVGYVVFGGRSRLLCLQRKLLFATNHLRQAATLLTLS